MLTALLVLAIGASSALVFTNRVELLKLAVILALWAAVVAAFVSVIYRRQSDVDQARARDLKLVYDLQLDREISARREYELTVESQLRRELASELRAQAADEVAALRAELSALRTNLEILFDAELDNRPALETERKPVRGYSDWEREDESPRDRISRVTSVRAEQTAQRAEDNSIIDVPEEPLAPPPRQSAYVYQAPDAYQASEPYEPPAYRGSHWQQAESRSQQPSSADWTPPESQPRGGWSDAEAQDEPQPRQRARRRYAFQPPPDEPRFEPPPPPPPPQPPQPEEQRPAWSSPVEEPAPQTAASDWQPVGAEGRWLPPGVPGSNWASGSRHDSSTVADDSAVREPTLAAPPPAERRGRHSSPGQPVAAQPGEVESGWEFGESDRRARARHSAEAAADTGRTPPHGQPAPAMSPPPQPAARHRGADSSSDSEGLHTGGQSVAELLARLQASPSGGGRRRRRED